MVSESLSLSLSLPKKLRRNLEDSVHERSKRELGVLQSQFALVVLDLSISQDCQLFSIICNAYWSVSVGKEKGANYVLFFLNFTATKQFDSAFLGSSLAHLEPKLILFEVDDTDKDSFSHDHLPNFTQL